MAVKDCVRREYIYLSNEIWNTLPQAEEEKELLLRCFREEILAFLSIPDSQGVHDMGSVATDDNQEIKRMHCRINSLLAAICEEAKQDSAASRLRRELGALQECYDIHDEDLTDVSDENLYQDMSVRISEAFRKLNIPGRFAQLLRKTETLFPPMHLGIDAGCPFEAYDVLENQVPEPAACDLLRRTALHIAAETGDGKLLQLALNRYDDAKKARDIFHMTALCIAAYMGHEDIFIRLAETDEDINVVDITGRNVLCIACGAGHLPIVQYLLDHGCRPNELGRLGPAGKYTPLHAAAVGGHNDVVDILLSYEASALLEYQGLTPAQEAANNGHLELAQKLLDVEKQQEASLPGRVDLSQHAYYLSMAQNSLAMPPSVAASPFAQPTLDHSATGVSSMLHSLMEPSQTHGESPLLQFSLYEDPTIGSLTTSLGSQSSRQPSEASSPALNSLKRPYDSLLNSSPRSSHSQPSSSTRTKRPHTIP